MSAWCSESVAATVFDLIMNFLIMNQSTDDVSLLSFLGGAAQKGDNSLARAL